MVKKKYLIYNGVNNQIFLIIQPCRPPAWPIGQIKQDRAGVVRIFRLTMKELVPEVGLEPTHLAVPDFESNSNFLKLLYFLA